MNTTPALAAVYSGWADHQQVLVAALAPLSQDQLLLRAAPHLRPINALAAHIAATRIGWLHGGLHLGDESLRQYFTWNQDDHVPTTADELVAGLKASWALVDDALSTWTVADIADEVATVWGGKPYLLPRGWTVWHVMEHDVHHAGEIFLTLGVHRLPTPDVGDVTGHIKPG